MTDVSPTVVHTKGCVVALVTFVCLFVLFFLVPTPVALYRKHSYCQTGLDIDTLFRVCVDLMERLVCESHTEQRRVASRAAASVS